MANGTPPADLKGADGVSRAPGGAGGVGAGAPPSDAQNAVPSKAGGASTDVAAGAKSGAAGADGAAGGALAKAGGAAGVAQAGAKGASAAQDLQNFQNKQSVTNAVKLAGNVDKRAAVAAKALEYGGKAKDQVAEQVDTAKEASDESKGPDQKEDTGAGGTSVQKKPSDSDGSVGGKAAAATGAAAGGATTATPILVFLAIINWLKTMFIAAMQAIMGWLSSLIAAVVNAVTAVVGAVTGFFTAAGAMISGFFGGAISAVTGTISAVTATVTAVVVAVAAFFGASSATVAQRDAPLINCAPAANAMVAGAIDASLTNDLHTEANAKRVYAILGGMGMPDVNIAGILGNWTAESGIDPTGVETIFDEKFNIGPRKRAAEAAGFSIQAIDASYAATYPAIKEAGIGLGQWTNGRNILLREYATGISKPWYELDTQLGFMISKDDPVRVAYIKSLISTPQPSVSAAVTDFMAKWEGLTDGSTGTRLTAAETWFAKFSGWTKDTNLANSIIAQSGAAVMGGNAQSTSTALANCRGAQGIADNSSLALAALSYAYATTAEGEGNNGTPLYQEIHDYVFPGDPYYKSCDRGVATAVRWSGTDDTFPAGPTGTQIDYLSTSPKWTEITGWGGDPKNLQPGDVLIRFDPPPDGPGVHHIVLYVGPELVQQVFGSKATPGANNVSASFQTRSPGAGNWYTGSEGLDTYRVFRSTGKEANSVYASYVPRASGNVPSLGGGGSTPTPTPTPTP